MITSKQKKEYLPLGDSSGWENTAEVDAIMEKERCKASMSALEDELISLLDLLFVCRETLAHSQMSDVGEVIHRVIKQRIEPLVGQIIEGLPA